MNYALFKIAIVILAIASFVYGIINVRTHLKKTIENPEKMDKKKFKRQYYYTYILTFFEAFVIGRSSNANNRNSRWRFRRICI